MSGSWPLAAVAGAVALAALAAPARGQPAPAADPQPELLWPGGAPGALGEGDADRPALTAFLPPPQRAVGAAVVVCPGGSYVRLAANHEGTQVARWLADHGVAAFVLRYRLGPRYHHPAPLQDVLRAVRTVRARAARLGVRPDHIGVWGFSAGGHLASSAATLFDAGDPRAVDPIDRVSARPDFAVLAYPVIRMTGEGTHERSRDALLGQSPPAALAEKLSTDRQVTARTPPTFLFHTSDDATVPVENSLAFYRALRRAGVPAELHVYEQGRHGLGLAASDPAVSSWTERLLVWLQRRGVLPAGERGRPP
jgi:acetyl esterase/lipase